MARIHCPDIAWAVSISSAVFSLFNIISLIGVAGWSFTTETHVYERNPFRPKLTNRSCLPISRRLDNDQVTLSLATSSKRLVNPVRKLAGSWNLILKALSQTKETILSVLSVLKKPKHKNKPLAFSDSSCVGFEISSFPRRIHKRCLYLSAMLYEPHNVFAPPFTKLYSILLPMRVCNAFQLFSLHYCYEPRNVYDPALPQLITPNCLSCNIAQNQ